MSSLARNNRGMSLIEVVLAMFMTVVAVLGIFSLVSPSWKIAARSDYLGRASGILNEQLMRQEAKIMNPCCIVTASTTGPTDVFASGQTASQRGDARYNVTTTIANVTANTWLVTVRVAWSGHPGISESIVVTRQQGFLFPASCTAGGTTCN
ncbi:MAG: hypothetical protein L7F78_01705 [Syntrophales bacterium LBB04]|nr:hypothetical protein [Syntrophales bacterium LBB04]